jgi:hypothetical protein
MLDQSTASAEIPVLTDSAEDLLDLEAVTDTSEAEFFRPVNTHRGTSDEALGGGDYPYRTALTLRNIGDGCHAFRTSTGSTPLETSGVYQRERQRLTKEPEWQKVISPRT